MKSFTEFERQVVAILVAPHLPEDVVVAVLDSGAFVSYDYTGSGYYLTVRHPALPSARIVCDEPNMIGKSGDIVCGFLIFLQDGELTLECHTWGPRDVPEDFRERDVEIEQRNIPTLRVKRSLPPGSTPLN